MSPKSVVDQSFVDTFNTALVQLGSAVTIAVTSLTSATDVFELRDDEGQFITLLPATATPEVTVVAYRLYGQGLNKGLRAGEELAWSKLRHLIGAAAVD